MVSCEMCDSQSGDPKIFWDATPYILVRILIPTFPVYILNLENLAHTIRPRFFDPF
jgi:hypothetical protein